MKFNKWDSLTNEEKVAQVRREVEAGALPLGEPVEHATQQPPITQVDPQWQDAMDDLADEKANLALVLRNLVTMWEKDGRVTVSRLSGATATTAWWDAMDSQIRGAKFVLNTLDKEVEV
jgi:hypothetical protein